MSDPIARGEMGRGAFEAFQGMRGMDLQDILRNPQFQNMVLAAGMGAGGNLLRAGRTGIPTSPRHVARKPLYPPSAGHRAAVGRGGYHPGRTTSPRAVSPTYGLDDLEFQVWPRPEQLMDDSSVLYEFRKQEYMRNNPAEFAKYRDEIARRAGGPDKMDDWMAKLDESIDAGGQMTMEPPKPPAGSLQNFDAVMQGVEQRVAGMADDALDELKDRAFEAMNEAVPNSPKHSAHEMVFRAAMRERWKRLQAKHGTQMARPQPESFEGRSWKPDRPILRNRNTPEARVEQELHNATRRANAKEAKADALRVPIEEGPTGPRPDMPDIPAENVGELRARIDIIDQRLRNLKRDSPEYEQLLTAQKDFIRRINLQHRKAGTLPEGFPHGRVLTDKQMRDMGLNEDQFFARNTTHHPVYDVRYMRDTKGKWHRIDPEGEQYLIPPEEGSLGAAPYTGNVRHTEPVNLPTAYKEMSDNTLLHQWAFARRAGRDAPEMFKPRIQGSIKMMEYEMKRRGFIPPGVKF
jgi:hypothetical protein